ncbi:MAG: chemotaxis protein CheX [Candidatus Sericytochromatia bacterium]|nr:chemotaxis protein CheX [Candidatus Sericytochromatia bacterium]
MTEVLLTTVRFFGQYLLERGCINHQQLLEAVEYQNVTNARLGTLALGKGYLTEAQIQRINLAQRTTDRLFGDLAVDLGLLSQDQLSDLIELQKSHRIFLGEALIEKGFMTREAVEAELAQFRSDQQASQMMIRGALIRLKDAEMVADVLDTVLKMFKRVLHENVLIEDCREGADQLMARDWSISQRFTGDLEATFTLNIPQGLLLGMAGRMLEEEFKTVDELVQDAGQEFVNIICGNIAAKLSVRNRNAGLLPPVIQPAATVKPSPDAEIIHATLISISHQFDCLIQVHSDKAA